MTEPGPKEWPVMSDFTWGSRLGVYWVFAAVKVRQTARHYPGVLPEPGLDSSDIIWHHLTSCHTCLGSVCEIVLLIFSKIPAFKPTSSSPPLPMEPLEFREKQRWFMCLAAAWVGFLSARNRNQQEASLVLLNYIYEEREKHHVESVQVLQPHTSGWIPLLPCSLQVCLHYYFISSSASCSNLRYFNLASRVGFGSWHWNVCLNFSYLKKTIVCVFILSDKANEETVL